MNPFQHILIFAVRVYRWTLSPAKNFLFGPLAGCRYTPSCSEYALEAIRTHGALAGSWLAVKRISRCHPWSECGHDAVPERGPVFSVQCSVFSTPKPEIGRAAKSAGGEN